MRAFSAPYFYWVNLSSGVRTAPISAQAPTPNIRPMLPVGIAGQAECEYQAGSPQPMFKRSGDSPSSAHAEALDRAGRAGALTSLRQAPFVDGEPL
jgi:hypothetical protein